MFLEVVSALQLIILVCFYYKLFVDENEDEPIDENILRTMCILKIPMKNPAVSLILKRN